MDKEISQIERARMDIRVRTTYLYMLTVHTEFKIFIDSDIEHIHKYKTKCFRHKSNCMAITTTIPKLNYPPKGRY